MSSIILKKRTGSIKLKQRSGSIKLKERTGRIEQTNRKIITDRDTTATYFDKNGILRTAAPHEVRYSKNFETGKQELLLEDAATNVLPNNRSIEDGNWSGENYVKDQIGLDGVANSAYKVQRNLYGNGGNAIGILGNDSLAIVPNTDYCATCYLKKRAVDNLCLLRVEAGGIDYGVFFNTADIFEQANRYRHHVNSFIVEEYPNWYRFGFTFNSGDVDTTDFYFYPGERGNTNYCILDGFQIEKGNSPSSLIITQDQPVTRPADKLVFAT